MPHRPAFVFFCYRRERPPITASRFVQVLRRQPLVAWCSILAGWIMIANGGSRIIHCAFGDSANGVVINPGLDDGNTLWALRAYAMVYPRIDGAITVHVQGHIDLERYPLRKPRRAWPTILRWLTMGLTPADNCVTLVADCLRQGGMTVPRRIQTPQALHDWLLQHGNKTPF